MQIKALAVLLPIFLSPVVAMGKASDALTDFIDDIPAGRLTGLPTNPGTIYSTDDFRLDMQGLTTATKNQPQAHNLQIQVNKQTKVKQLQKLAPATVAGPVLVPVKNPMDAETVRSKFKASMKI